MVFCGKCGTKNPDDNLYCRQCGSSLSKEVSEERKSIPTIPEERQDPSANEVHCIPTPDSNPNGSGADRAMMVFGGLLMAVAVAYLMFLKQVDWNVMILGKTVETESGTMWDIMTGSSTPVFSAVFIIAMIGMVMSVASPVFSLFGLVGTVGCYIMAGNGVVLELAKEMGEAVTLQTDATGPMLIAAIICLSLTFIGIWGYVSLARATGRWDPIALTWRSIV